MTLTTLLLELCGAHSTPAFDNAWERKLVGFSVSRTCTGRLTSAAVSIGVLSGGELGAQTRDLAFEVAYALQQPQRHRQAARIQLEIVAQATGGTRHGDDTRAEAVTGGR